MIVVPAIDLLDGKAVRLEQGRYDRVTVYDDDPVERARAFERAGAARLHVVDLEGARRGAPAQAEVIRRILAAVSIPVQVGGGIRSASDARAVVEAGARAVVMGTSAVKSPQDLREACRAAPVVVAIDARGGRVAVEGWTETSEVDGEDLAARVMEWGAVAILYTDVLRDGMRSGPNLPATAHLAAIAGGALYASGGVGAIDDLLALCRIEPPLAGAIVGRALYAGAFTLEEAIEACSRAE